MIDGVENEIGVSERTLFNEYEAYNELGYEISHKTDSFIKEIINSYPDVSTRDLENVICDGVMSSLAESRLRRAMEKGTWAAQKINITAKKNEIGEAQ